MSVLDSLTVDIFGLSIVFLVLIALSLVVKLISKVVSGLTKKSHSTQAAQQETKVIATPAGQEASYADGELKLFHVDQKTAAMIMAIVSDESKIPLSQLHFKSIRLMK